MTYIRIGPIYDCYTFVILGRKCSGMSSPFPPSPYDPCNDPKCGSSDCLWSGLSIDSQSGTCPTPERADYAFNIQGGGGACTPVIPNTTFAAMGPDGSCCKQTYGNCIKAASCSWSDASDNYTIAVEMLPA